jgi:hypothetical protein
MSTNIQAPEKRKRKGRRQTSIGVPRSTPAKQKGENKKNAKVGAEPHAQTLIKHLFFK